MKKAYRLKKDKEFQLVFKQGESFANRQLVIYFLKKTEQTHFRIGLSVSKKIGNAVMRNQIKRYLRQAFLELDQQIDNTYDVIVIARVPTNKMNFLEIKKSLIHVLTKSHVLKR
jgi:ribonuclease P protein component